MLKEVLSSELPGWEAHKLMSPVGEGGYLHVPDNHKKAAVLLLIHYVNGVPEVVFMKRTSHHPQDKHAGQISFPGGALESDDNNLQSCAIRETHEELGVKEDAYEIVGALSPLYVYVSNFLMYPFVAYTENTLLFKKEDEEVERVISWPLHSFLQKDSKQITDLKIRNMTMKDVPYFSVSGDILWGATAMVMSEFLVVLKQA